MSLKVIHVAFIVASTLMCVGIAVLRLSAWRAGAGPQALVQGASASIGAILLIGYVVHFIRKYGRLGSQ